MKFLKNVFVKNKGSTLLTSIISILIISIMITSIFLSHHLVKSGRNKEEILSRIYSENLTNEILYRKEYVFKGINKTLINNSYACYNITSDKYIKIEDALGFYRIDLYYEKDENNNFIIIRKEVFSE